MANKPIVEDLSPAFKKRFSNLSTYTNDILFKEVWLDEQLDSKTRSIVTLSILAALGNSEQMTFHLETARNNGVSKKELTSLCTHLAFYIGWPQTMLLVDKILVTD
ncbi:carboxymuconolactone decarboxylase family protein [Listeria welshimeri]|uniref:Carboxymuconolactone decarboxylase n=1 Tax=Listeria welshimeri TaxID=1643 RepID=A0ABX4IEA0_LISWE|nr:carboxymuconolactone decarboxylase family protein [Listeria welshimeri]MBC2282289.1 carboxymuconolactone decarboxylase family protein [Listeria welshimeri]MBC2673628.1 carboxymuconolactone decarboxylase family protein [Listeria welshimeri]MBF2445671.1 carboxymuconolactone decarboxylase family protein [Listeria welshimeri]MBF2471491.1 carboxymuconolactone decarboxylase family protein [Listeria welshimeri]MBF2485466.1 carboxymuconolactone decarboxylase family protein [Listeria welshimeri]